MGGVVIRIAMSLEKYESGSIGSVINLASPLQAPPAPFESDLVKIYSITNSYWREKFYCGNDPEWKNLAVLSVAAGNRDIILNSELCSLEGVIPESNGLFLFTSSVPYSWTTADHNSIVWSYSFVKALFRAIVQILEPKNNQPTFKFKPALEVIEIYRDTLGSSFLFPHSDNQVPKLPFLNDLQSVSSCNITKLEDIYFFNYTLNAKATTEITAFKSDIRRKLILVSNIKFAENFEFYMLENDNEQLSSHLLQKRDLFPIYHLPYIGFKGKLKINTESYKNHMMSVWKLEIDKMNTLLMIASQNDLRTNMPNRITELNEHTEEYYEKPLILKYFTEETKKKYEEQLGLSKFILIMDDNSFSYKAEQLFSDMLFGTYHINLKAQVLLHQVHFPSIMDGLSAIQFKIETVDGKTVEGMQPVCRAFSSSIGEEKYYVGEWSFVVTFHDHFSGALAFQQFQHLQSKHGVSNASSGFILNCWLDPRYSYRLSYTANLQVSMGQLCRKFGIGFLTFPFAVLMISFLRSLIFYFKRSQFPSFEKSITMEMKKAHSMFFHYYYSLLSDKCIFLLKYRMQEMHFAQ